jgi:hypothetical protein
VLTGMTFPLEDSSKNYTKSENHVHFAHEFNFGEAQLPPWRKLEDEAFVFLFSLDDAAIRGVLLSGFH